MTSTWEDLWPSDEDPLDGVVITDVEEESERPKQRRSTNIKRKHKATYRRAFSETQLLDICDLPFQEGNSYHFITGGDVDALSYLKIVLRQQNLKYCLFSTWCMAKEDVYQMQDWLESGKIKRTPALRLIKSSMNFTRTILIR